jgi:hypothetical protein
MSNDWLERSLSSLQDETKEWPQWKRDAASTELHLAIPDPQSTQAREDTLRSEPEPK